MNTLTLTDTAFVGSPLLQETVDGQRNIVAAGSSISLGALRAVNRAMFRMQQGTLWAKTIVADFCCGLDLTAARVRWKFPVGVAVSYSNTNFVSGDYTQSTGLGNATNTNKFLNSLLNPVTLGWDPASLGVHVYALGVDTGNRTMLGVDGNISADNSTGIGRTNTAGGDSGLIAANFANRAPATSPNRTGLVSVVTNGSRSQQLYQNGAASGSPVTASASFTNGPIYKFAVNRLGTGPAQYCQRRLGSSYITTGLSSTEMALLYSIVQEFETALGRQV